MLTPPIDLDHRRYIQVRHQLYADTMINPELVISVDFQRLIPLHHRLVYCIQIDLKQSNVAKN